MLTIQPLWLQLQTACLCFRGEDILLPPTSCQWFENLPCQLYLCWWPVLQKAGKLREVPSSQMTDRCALQALEAGLFKIQEDPKCLFKLKWFHDNSSSIFLSSGMGSKSSICSSPIKAWQVLGLSGAPHLHKLHRHLSSCAWRCQGLYHCSTKWFLRTIRNRTGEQSRLCCLVLL